MKNTFNQKETFCIFKYFIIIAFTILLFNATAIISYAAGCSGGDCPCASTYDCGSLSCPTACSGHSWKEGNPETLRTNTVTRTCSRDGYKEDLVLTFKYCTRSTCSYEKPRKDENESWGSPYEKVSHTGCNFTSWYNGDSTHHYKHCQNGHHVESIDGSKTDSARHSLGDEHQGSGAGDWKWHKSKTA